MESPLDILARLAPGAALESVLFQVPASSRAHIQGLTVANRGASPASFRFSLSPFGAPTAASDYVYYDLPLEGNDTFMSLLNVDLFSRDSVRVYSSNANLTFILYGGPR